MIPTSASPVGGNEGINQSGFNRMMNQYLNKSYGSCRPDDAKKNIPLPFILKFPFIDEIVRHNINCSQYKYLTIITDGTINPTPNVTRVGIPRNNLMLEFDNGKIWKIEHSIWNLNIENFGSVKFTNLNYDIMIGAHPCNGYGNISLIFTVNQFPKFDVHIQPPHFCETGTIASNTTIEWWAGKYRFNAGWLLRIPYIPLGYKDLRMQFWQADGAAYTYWIHQYCCGDVGFCETTAAGQVGNVCINVPLFSDRIYIAFRNQDLLNPHVFCAQATWIRKGKF